MMIICRTKAREMSESRELTSGERTAIKKLVVSMCANYDSKYACLPLDYGRCYMLDKWWTGGYCKYFRDAVLPLDPILEATLTGGEMPQQEICAVCGNLFIADAQQIYCSPACQKEGNRRRSRERMRNKRKKEQAERYD
jgi:predicted nucleic acid-binding Zn ribbon protein